MNNSKVGDLGHCGGPDETFRVLVEGTIERPKNRPYENLQTC